MSETDKGVGAVDAENPTRPCRQHLLVRVRKTASGDGSTKTVRTVYCPSRGETMNIEDCASCSKYTALTFESGDRDMFLVCEPDQAADNCATNGPAQSTGSDTDKLSIPIYPNDVSVCEVMSTDTLCVTEDVSVDAILATLLDRGEWGSCC
ncbi:MAG: hypothetical protein R3C68_08355 [Myxococcota bacterium]